jgi:photosystem II S4 domain protein
VTGHVTEDRVIEGHREPRPNLTGSRPNRPGHQNLGSRLYRFFIAARIGRSPNRPRQTHRNLRDRLGRLSPSRATAFGDRPSELPLDTEQVELTALSIAGNFLFDPASHRDFLGSILGTGIVREKVGDILVLGERGAQAIVVPDLVEFFQQSMTQVRTVPVKVTPIPFTELQVREPRKKELTTVEASLRLDAIASAGFGMSRSKMVDLINKGEVRVNWKDISQPSHQLKDGDLVAIRGKGRLFVGDIAVTKKDRYRVLLTRVS